MRRKNSPGCPCCGQATDPCYIQCNPCWIPSGNLTLVVNGGGSRTLEIDQNANIWTDGTYTVTCSSGRIRLSGGVGSWTIDGSTCYPFSVSFSSGPLNNAVLTGPPNWPARGSGNCVYCPTCLCPKDVHSPIIATYNGKTYTLTNGSHNLGVTGSVFEGWANDTAVYQPSTNSTAGSGSPCSDGCGSNGDVPTWIWIDTFFRPTCLFKLRTFVINGCPSPGEVCWKTATGPDPTYTQYFDIPLTEVSKSCAPNFKWSGTAPATVGPVVGLPGSNTLAVPGGGGKVEMTAQIQRARPQLCCFPCPIPKTDLTISWDFGAPLFGYPATGSMPLTFNSSTGQWSTTCIPDAGGAVRTNRWVLMCSNNIEQLFTVFYLNTSCNPPAFAAPVMPSPPLVRPYVSVNCDPFHMHILYNNIAGKNIYIDE